ncbi:MAG: sulfotransferase [Candidatus Sedimenticola sp. (ex Thyasira tokunagai)]
MSKKSRTSKKTTISTKAHANNGGMDTSYRQAIGLWQAGRLQESAILLGRLLNANPRHGDALHLLGVIHAQSGHAEQAVEMLQRAVSCDRKNPDMLLTLGNTLNSQMKFIDAYTVFKKALKLKPNFPEVHNGIGMSLSGQKRHHDAIKHYDLATRQKPGFVAALCNYGAACLELHDFDRAIEKLSHANRLVPNNPDTLKNLGTAYLQKGDSVNSLACFSKNLELLPDDLGTLLSLASAGIRFRSFDEALNALKTLKSKYPENPQGYIYSGDLHIEEGDLDAAVMNYRRAGECGANLVETSYKIGKAYALFGHFTEAAAYYREVLDLDPTMASAVRELAIISENLDAAELIGKFAPLLESDAISDDEKVKLCFAMGKACDDARMYEQAFDYYTRGNRLKYCKFDREAFSNQVECLMAIFTPSFFQQWADIASSSVRPVFIVGMPRSGTSLAEQVLASHSAIFGSGEQQFWGDLTRIVCERLEADRPYPDCLSAIEEHHLLDMIRAFEEHLSTFNTDAARIIDKMPSNFLYLGLIGLLFPKAKIILCEREPMDNCLSIFFQNFSTIYSYSFDLGDLGFYYRQYQRLMNHWEQSLPNPIRHLQYETMVGCQEEVTREILGFLDLEWESRCLQHHKTERVVKTASSWQARQPIYTTSVERWKNYSTHLGPLQHALGL